MFMINASCLLLAVLYSIIRLKVTVAHSSAVHLNQIGECFINSFSSFHAFSPFSPEKNPLHSIVSGKRSRIKDPLARWDAVAFCRTISTTAM